MAVSYYQILFILIPSVLMLNTCNQRKTCNECIRDSSLCMWCSSDNFNCTNRCVPETENLTDWCVSTDIINPKQNVIPVEYVNFSSEIGKVVQTKPQKINIEIRPGGKVNFEFSFKNADDYPVDLYFLFDGSTTMNEIKNTTAKKSRDIYLMMKSMTKNLYLGMGSFVDKNALPYTQSKNSSLSYSFRNKLKLTENYELFQSAVSESSFGLNYDSQEGTLDALAQVIVCRNEIGWRNESRKIIIVLTDQSYHAAGDGKWAGIFQPYDGKCYTVDGVYTKELNMDYPSVNIINKLASEEEIIVFFLIAMDVRSFYESLKESINGSKIATYEGSYGKIVQTLKSTYEQMTRNLKLKVNMKGEYREYVHISFSPDCYRSNRKCNIKNKKEFKVKGTLKLSEYFNSESFEVGVGFEGIKEKLMLNVNVLHSCNCKTEQNSSLCNHGGTRRCGICECYQDRYGDKCSNPNDNSTCIAPKDTVLCSGRGSCLKGKCLCRDGYDDEYCQCIKDSCVRDDNDNMCSYPNGECKCGVCNCKPKWVGDLCACPVETDCKDENGTICNKWGECTCGKCQCNKLADWDVRHQKKKYCRLSCGEHSPEGSCHKRQCFNLEPLALCYLKGSECYHSLEYVDIILESSLAALNFTKEWQECPKIRVDFAAYTKFIYRYNEDEYGIKMIIQSNYDYAEKYYVIGGTCLGLLILIGIATIIGWKYLTDRRDRKEYEAFLKESSETTSECANPIHEPASTTFQNPTFHKRSFRS